MEWSQSSPETRGYRGTGRMFQLTTPRLLAKKHVLTLRRSFHCWAGHAPSCWLWQIQGTVPSAPKSADTQWQCCWWALWHISTGHRRVSATVSWSNRPMESTVGIGCWKTQRPKPNSITGVVAVTNSNHYPGVKACILVLLSLPVSTAIAERLFSAMHRIKTYLRSTMTTGHILAWTAEYLSRERNQPRQGGGCLCWK